MKMLDGGVFFEELQLLFDRVMNLVSLSFVSPGDELTDIQKIALKLPV